MECFVAFKERMGARLSAKERIVAFMSHYVAYFTNRVCRGTDVMIAYETVKGNKPTMADIEFGEKLLFNKHAGARLETINSRCEHGMIVGVRKRSDDLIVVTRSGTKHAHSARRVPFENGGALTIWNGFTMQLGATLGKRRMRTVRSLRG